MSLIAEYVLDPPVLRESLAAVPEMTVHYENETIPGEGRARLVFRAEGGDFEAFEAAMDRDLSVAAWTRLASVDDHRLYRIDLTRDAEAGTTYGSIIEMDGFIVDATGTHEGWRVRIQFPDREALAAYRDVCEECGIDSRLENLYRVTEDANSASDLTDRQRKALEAALELGYFDIPRQVSTAELGEELGVSGQAVSERLRRALGTAARIALDEERDGA